MTREERLKYNHDWYIKNKERCKEYTRDDGEF